MSDDARRGATVRPDRAPDSGGRSILRRTPARLAVVAAIVALLGTILPVSSGRVDAISPPTLGPYWGTVGSGDGQFLNGGYYVGVAVAGSGNVYVTDNGNNRVEEFTSSGAYMAQWGEFGSGDGQFKYPFGIAVDGSGNVYVADASNNRVQKFNSSGGYLTQWGSFGSGDGQFWGPYGIAVDNLGNVYVADASNNRIEKFDSSGGFLTQWGSGGSGNGQFALPFGIAVDGSGYVYVVDTGNARVQKFTSSGSYVTQWGSGGTGDDQFFYPTGVAVDGSGNVYVADTSNNRVQEFDSSGAPLVTWGSMGSLPGQFNGPLGMAVDCSANVYVADIVNSRIEEFAPSPATAATAPAAPATVAAAAGDGLAAVSWLPPATDGGSAIGCYTVTAHDSTTGSDGPHVFTRGTSATNATVVGLTNGDTYSFSVTATNSVGTSLGSDSSASVTPGPYTPTGTGVTVVPTTAGAPSPVITTFSDVTAGGTTSVTVIDTSAPSAPPPMPPGYRLSGSPVYYDIQTTASYTGPITVCLTYAGITPMPTNLLHYTSDASGGTWTDITNLPIDTAGQVICGTTSSLSPFALATWTAPVLTVPSNISATATGSTGAVVTFSATAHDSAGAALTPTCTPASGTTFSVGTTKVSCTATDARQRTSSTSFTVTVGYRLSGFFQPLNDPISSTNPMSVFKGGSTITVKFALTYANGTPILDTAAATIASACGATISLAQTAGTAPPVDEVVTSTTANSGACFRYDSTAHQFVFNLGTKGLPAPAQYALGASIVGPDNTLLATHRLAIGLR